MVALSPQLATALATERVAAEGAFRATTMPVTFRVPLTPPRRPRTASAATLAVGGCVLRECEWIKRMGRGTGRDMKHEQRRGLGGSRLAAVSATLSSRRARTVRSGGVVVGGAVSDLARRWAPLPPRRPCGLGREVVAPVGLVRTTVRRPTQPRRSWATDDNGRSPRHASPLPRCVDRGAGASKRGGSFPTCCLSGRTYWGGDGGDAGGPQHGAACCGWGGGGGVAPAIGGCESGRRRG